MTAEPLFVTEGGAPPHDLDLDFWASALAHARPVDHVIALPGSGKPEPVLAGDEGDGWRAGAYCGALELDGQRLVFRSRMDDRHLLRWLRAAVDMPGEASVVASEGAGVAPLVGLVWTRAVDDASRHGPPAFRREVLHTGPSIKGRIDVRRSIRLLAAAEPQVASVFRTRDLDNPVTRVIVAADRALVRQIGHSHWRTERVKDMLPQLHSAVGRRAQVPHEGELHRMRYTPITRGFKRAAEVSSRIVRQDRVTTTPQPGRIQGVLIDLAGVWADAVLVWAREARADLRVEAAEPGVIVLRDRRSVRATLFVRSGGDPSGAPAMRTMRSGAESELVMPVDTEAARQLVFDVVGSA